MPFKLTGDELVELLDYKALVLGKGTIESCRVEEAVNTVLAIGRSVRERRYEMI